MHIHLRRHLLALPLSMALLVLTACATAPAPRSAQLTYETQPEGATLYEGGQSIGVAPVQRIYPAAAEGAQIRTPEVTAVWPSGAKETYFTLLPAGADRVATIERPAAAPGLQADLDHARKFQTARQQALQREKEALAREQRQNSDRCKAQRAGASPGAVLDDC